MIDILNLKTFQKKSDTLDTCLIHFTQDIPERKYVSAFTVQEEEKAVR